MIPPPPARTAAPVREAGAGPASTPWPPAPAGTAMDKQTRANTQGRHTDGARRQQASTNRSGMGAKPSMARATPRTPALLPAQGRQRDRPRQGDPPPHWPPRPHSRGEQRTGRPPPAPHPPALERPRRADPPHREHTAPSHVGGKRNQAPPPPPPPPKQTKRGTGPGQDTPRGTDRVERRYQRPAPGPREVRAPHQPGEGGGARTPQERERTHTKRKRGENQKGNRTEPAERTDRMEWLTSERG